MVVKLINKSKKKLRRKIPLYITACACLCGPAIIFFAIANAVTKITPVEKITCLNQTGNCSLGTYPPNKDCNVDNVTNVNGGTNCKSTCDVDHLSYNCQCPTKKAWDKPLLNCSMACQNTTANCVEYVDGAHCVPTTTSVASDCKAFCNATVTSFECTCPMKYNWDPVKHDCILPCLTAPTMACTEIQTSTVGCAITPPDVLPADPLSVPINPCDAFCLDSTKLDYRCSCAPGFMWKQDTHECIFICTNKTVVNCLLEVQANSPCSVTDAMATILKPNTKPNACTTTCLNEVLSYECLCISDSFLFQKKNLNCYPKCKIVEELCDINNTLDKICVHPMGADIDCHTMCDSWQKSTGGIVNTTYPIYTYTCECPKYMIYQANFYECTEACLEISSGADCTVYKDGQSCQTKFSKDDVDSCKRSCNDGVASYSCYCTTSKWISIEKECRKKCPKDNAACKDENWVANTPCGIPDDIYAANCIAVCDEAKCLPAICDCIGDVNKFYDPNHQKCLNKCVKDPNNKACVGVTTDVECFVEDWAKRYFWKPYIKCDATYGLHFTPGNCFNGGWDYNITEESCDNSQCQPDGQGCGQCFTVRPNAKCVNNTQTDCKITCVPGTPYDGSKAVCV